MSENVVLIRNKNQKMYIKDIKMCYILFGSCLIRIYFKIAFKKKVCLILNNIQIEYQYGD